MIGRGNVAGARVIVDGRDITPLLEGRVANADRRRLVSLTITEKRGDEADQLDLTIDDTDGLIALPRAGARVQVALGWIAGAGVAVGLIDKGSFVVEDVEHAGPPDLVTIRARAADFTSEIRTRREHSWTDTTLGQVVSDLAHRNRLEPRCAPSLASIVVRALAQSRESDIAFLRRLGRAHDALASVKDGKLLLSPVGALTTTTGKRLPQATLYRREGDRHVFKIEKPQEAGAVEAQWNDVAGGERRTERHGSGKHARRLGRIYPTREAAQQAATAEHGRASRVPKTLDLSLALGRADLYPDQRVTVTGFKVAIDGVSWLVAETSHMVSDQGFTTKLRLDAAESR